MTIGKKTPLSQLGAVAPPELRELGDRVRRLVDAMLRIDHPADALLVARDRVDAAARLLEEVACNDESLRLGRPDEPDGARPYLVDGVLLPAHHPLASAPRIATEDGVTRGRVRFGVVFEGPPGCVHGGHVASFFDQILGYHTLELGLPAMTAELCIRYRRPTPLFQDLDFEVRIQRIDGRKIDVLGELRSALGGECFAEAEGLFILPSEAANEALHGLVRPRP